MKRDQVPLPRRDRTGPIDEVDRVHGMIHVDIMVWYYRNEPIVQMVVDTRNGAVREKIAWGCMFT